MRICCIADLHGYIVDVPDCDLLLLAGDYQTCKDGTNEWNKVYKPWINNIAERGIKVVGVAGNHDWMFYNHKDGQIKDTNWTYLQDNCCEFKGYNIWGTPWQPRFYDWAFNLDEPDLKKRWDLIPNNTDILLLHGPPRGYGDLLHPAQRAYPYERTGSPSLTAKITEIQPKLVVCGHIHSGFGIYQLGSTIIINAAMLNENYRPVNNPVIVEI